MPKTVARRTLSLSLCVGLLLPFSVPSVQAQSITLEIGQPNVWSLAQAHYLLSHMRHENRSLHATPPTAAELNPNSINGARLDILRTFLGIGAEFSAPAAAQNRAALQGFQQSMARRQDAQNRASALTQQHLAVVQEISDLNFQLAQVPAPPPADSDNPEDPQTTALRRELTAKVQARVPVRDALAAEIASLNTILNAAPPTLSSLSATSPTPPSVSFNDDIKDLMGKLVSGSTSPQINASTALDNYVQMQYEVIAKQLTLLRDEVGPDERLIFLELPASLYSVPKRDDNYIVQTRWNVHSYLGTCSDMDESEDSDEDGALPDLNEPAGPRERKQRRPITIDTVNAFESLGSQLTDENNLRLARAYRFASRVSKIRGADSRRDYLTTLRRSAPQVVADMEKVETLREQNPQLYDTVRQVAEIDPESFPQTFWDLRRRPVSERARREFGGDPCPVKLSAGKFRIIDIIPRLSALNINDTHATQKGFALTAKFLALFGFGASVGFQRQRSVYEQFIHQDVFASGFGKGLDNFGWTIGPNPGTKRLAPGPRTTYAILAIPRGALAVKLEANAIAFRNKDAPDDRPTPLAVNKQFTVLVPQRDTEGFWVDSVAYTPVPSGQRVTVLLGGKYFSPLTGITVDGQPLRRAVALAKHESEEATNETDTNAPGEFEYLNSNELVLSFKMAADYVGTPVITLITPEKTSAINYFTDLRINFNRTSSLIEHSKTEPMFIGGFGITGLRGVRVAGGNVTASLVGTGFRNRATITVNGTAITRPRLRSTALYELSFPNPAAPEWKVTYRLGQQEASVVFTPDVDGLTAVAPSVDSIENPSTGKPEGPPDGGEQVIIRGRNLGNVSSVMFGPQSGTIDTYNRHPNVLLVTVPKGKAGGVRVLLSGQTAAGQSVSNILDFQTPGKAIYKYVAPPKEEPKPKPEPKDKKRTRRKRGGA